MEFYDFIYLSIYIIINNDKQYLILKINNYEQHKKK